MEEYKFDGFRFDGVTSMMYVHMALALASPEDTTNTFGDQVDFGGCCLFDAGMGRLYIVFRLFSL